MIQGIFHWAEILGLFERQSQLESPQYHQRFHHQLRRNPSHSPHQQNDLAGCGVLWFLRLGSW